MLEVKEGFDWKRYSSVIGVVVITAAAIGASVCYKMDQRAKEEKAAAEKNVQASRIVPDISKDSAPGKAKEVEAIDETAAWTTYTDTTYNFSFKHPANLVIEPANLSKAEKYYLISIYKSEDVDESGSALGDVSHAYLQVDTSSRLTGSSVVINSPAGEIAATYSAKNFADTPGYSSETYEFQKGGKYYLFGMNNLEAKPLLTVDQFRQLVDTITLN